MITTLSRRRTSTGIPEEFRRGRIHFVEAEPELEGDAVLPARALSVIQPWADLIGWGAKSLETRSWQTNWRGPIAIHASSRVLDLSLAGFGPLLREAVDRNLWPTRPDRRGSIVAVAVVRQVWRTDMLRERCADLIRKESHLGDFSPGRYAWALVDVLQLERPVPCRGAQGLWPIPPDVRAQVAAQLGGWRPKSRKANP